MILCGGAAKHSGRPLKLVGWREGVSPLMRGLNATAEMQADAEMQLVVRCLPGQPDPGPLAAYALSVRGIGFASGARPRLRAWKQP